MNKIVEWSIQLASDQTIGIFEVDDNATDDEIEAMARDIAFNGVNWDWSVKTND